MTKKVFIITEEEIKNAVKNSLKKVIFESSVINSYEQDGHSLAVVDYDMKNEDDKNYILSNKDTIWNILIKGYESKGGFKGFQSVRDMLKKSPFYKLGFYDNEIVAVTVYNGYLGDSKCVEATAVKNDKHLAGVEMLQLIIEHNIVDWERWIWVEASGKIEEMCKNSGAFIVPNKYVNLYLGHIPYTPIDGDEYHYERMIGGEMEEKTIFGFKDQETFIIIKEKLNNDVNEFLKKKEISLNESDDLYAEYLSKKHPVYTYKSIIDFFVYLKDDELCNEFTEEMVSELKNAMSMIEKYKKDKTLSEQEKYYLEIAIEEGERVLNTVSVFKPITPRLTA